MRLINSVSVAAPPDAVFALLGDVERVVTCMPGAALEGRDGDGWRGGVKVKVGPVSAAYTGTVRFLDAEPDKRHLRIHARGHDAHGNGDAEAEVLLDVLPAEDGAQLSLTTDLLIRGKLAQFGKGAIGSVSERILQQFARNLGELIAEGTADEGAGGAGSVAAAPASADGAAGASGASGAPVRTAAPTASAAPLDGLDLVAGPLLRTYGPVAAGFAVGLLHGWLWGRVRGQSRQLRQQAELLRDLGRFL
ncbi:SRPBCC family protein [Streptomyces sp. NPDC001941]|uniref:SRPBCC family protein n=1 Tax=Streptomyces sp. NPDC001941 TaxID=3154659 RepID=UPI00332B5511